MTARVVLLMNFVAPYRLPLFQAVRRDLRVFRIFVSTPMEPDRPWKPEWQDLDVSVQKTVTRHVQRQHKEFRQDLFIHFPYDTLPRLFRDGPDVVISGELGLRSLQAAIYRVLRRRSRLLIWATLSESTERGWGPVRVGLRRFILRCSDGVIVNGASGARYIASLRPTLPVFVMNQPIDVSRFSTLPLERSREVSRRLVYSGRLIGQKGVVEFQRVVAQWAAAHPDQQVELVWLGDGELRPVLESAATPANLLQTFAGYVSYDALPAAYADCGALVLPSRFDEWGLVVNEAMASGLPVLGSINSQAVEEMVSNGITGWCFDPDDPESMAGALDAFFALPDDALMSMRRAARTRALNITPESAAACMLEAIRSVVPSPKADALVTEGAGHVPQTLG